METIPYIMIGLYGLGAVISLVIIIVLIAKRLKAKQNETFEKRDN